MLNIELQAAMSSWGGDLANMTACKCHSKALDLANMAAENLANLANVAENTFTRTRSGCLQILHLGSSSLLHFTHLFLSISIDFDTGDKINFNKY